VVLAIGAALVAALVVRQASGPEATRRLALVAAAALGVRLAAVTAIYLIAIRSHGEGTFFNDEASFYLAAESLLPNPLDKPLPTGLEHLGTDAYLGLLTGLSLALGSSYSHMDTVAFRLVNATLGTLVAITTSIITARLVGYRAALVAGLLVALWPTLVLWSATFLRDTLASFIVVVTWWTLVFHRRLTDVRVLGVVLLAWLLLATLRPYLAGALTLGVIGWAVWPLIPRRSPRVLAGAAAAVVVLGLGVAALQARRIDESAHQLVYRQLTTRMETQGRLYRDPIPNDPPYEPPFRPGAAVATIDPDSGWISPGLIERPLGPGVVLVGFPDGSEQRLPITELTLLQSAPLTPLQLLLSLQPGLITFLSGTSDAGDPGLGWVADSLAWDVLFIVAITGGIRARIPVRDWIFPASIVLGTAMALIAVPGAPGNDDRHRASQAIPLLVVFATGWLVSRRLASLESGASVSSATSMPMIAGTAASSRTRSLL
jgi:hypothetical protein